MHHEKFTMNSPFPIILIIVTLVIAFETPAIRKSVCGPTGSPLSCSICKKQHGK